jgi:hypothetical protein
VHHMDDTGSWPSVVLAPGEVYTQRTGYRFTSTRRGGGLTGG